jgi:hypothetical protein
VKFKIFISFILKSILLFCQVKDTMLLEYVKTYNSKNNLIHEVVNYYDNKGKILKSTFTDYYYKESTIYYYHYNKKNQLVYCKGVNNDFLQFEEFFIYISDTIIKENFHYQKNGDYTYKKEKSLKNKQKFYYENKFYDSFSKKNYFQLCDSIFYDSNDREIIKKRYDLQGIYYEYGDQRTYTLKPNTLISIESKIWNEKNKLIEIQFVSFDKYNVSYKSFNQYDSNDSLLSSNNYVNDTLKNSTHYSYILLDSILIKKEWYSSSKNYTIKKINLKNDKLIELSSCYGENEILSKNIFIYDKKGYLIKEEHIDFTNQIPLNDEENSIENLNTKTYFYYSKIKKSKLEKH